VRRVEPALEEHARGPVLCAAGLGRHRALERLHHLREIAATKALVPVRQDGQPDQDVRVRVLGGARRHVLANEWDGEQHARPRHGAVQPASDLAHVLRPEQPARDAVDLGQAVGSERVEPVPGKVEGLESHAVALGLDPRCSLA